MYQIIYTLLKSHFQFLICCLISFAVIEGLDTTLSTNETNSESHANLSHTICFSVTDSGNVFPVATKYLNCTSCLMILSWSFVAYILAFTRTHNNTNGANTGMKYCNQFKGTTELTLCASTHKKIHNTTTNAHKIYVGLSCCIWFSKFCVSIVLKRIIKDDINIRITWIKTRDSLFYKSVDFIN